MIKKSAVLSVSFAACLGLIVSYGSGPALADNEIITFAFNKRPPFYYLEEGIGKGFVLERTVRALDRSGIRYQLEELPFERIFSNLREKKPDFAALGFSKTPERARYVRFSEPLTRDDPLQVMVRQSDHEKFARIHSLRQLLAEPSLTFGGKAGAYYPVSDLLVQLGDRDIRFQSELINFPKLLINRRFDYTMLYPGEVDYSLDHSKVGRDEVELIKYPGMPEGKPRYLLFSMAIPDNVIQKINRAIRSTR